MIASAPWAEAIAEQLAATPADPTVRFAFLANTEPDGSPRVRAMVIREVDAATGRVVFTADARSEKSHAFEADNRAELCWYFGGAWVQYRLRGTVAMHTADAAGFDRQALWDGLSPDLKGRFFWPAPGTPVVGEAQAPELDDARLARPPAQFVVGVLEVNFAERLELTTHPHRRTVYDRSAEGWSSRQLWA